MHKNCLTNQMPGNDSNSLKSDQKLIRPEEALMSLLNKFELNLISSLSENARKLIDQSQGRKQHEFSGAWPKVNTPVEAPNEFSHQIWAGSDQQGLIILSSSSYPFSD